MGTRADFYVGRGADAQWLGSIAWDGHPDGIDEAILAASDEAGFRAAVAAFLVTREDATRPEQGWPWPWDSSHTTDFAYALDAGRVLASSFGHPWQPAGDYDSDRDDGAGEMAPDAFPNMSARRVLALGKRSGLIYLAPEPSPPLGFDPQTAGERWDEDWEGDW